MGTAAPTVEVDEEAALPMPVDAAAASVTSFARAKSAWICATILAKGAAADAAAAAAATAAAVGVGATLTVDDGDDDSDKAAGTPGVCGTASVRDNSAPEDDDDADDMDETEERRLWPAAVGVGAGEPASGSAEESMAKPL
jgi:hypothetical protein